MYRTLGCSGGILASSTDLSTPLLPMHDIKVFLIQMVPTPSTEEMPRTLVWFQDHLLGIAVGHTFFFEECGWSESVLMPFTRIDWIAKKMGLLSCRKKVFPFPSTAFVSVASYESSSFAVRFHCMQRRMCIRCCPPPKAFASFAHQDY